MSGSAPWPAGRRARAVPVVRLFGAKVEIAGSFPRVPFDGARALSVRLHPMILLNEWLRSCESAGTRGAPVREAGASGARPDRRTPRGAPMPGLAEGLYWKNKLHNNSMEFFIERACSPTCVVTKRPSCSVRDRQGHGAASGASENARAAIGMRRLPIFPNTGLSVMPLAIPEHDWPARRRH